MKRELMHRLISWKASSWRKPLLLMGTRQVGKTTLLRTFGKTHYRNVVEINFDNQPALKTLFEQNLKPERIVRDIALELETDIIPGETLLFFDEIQECPNALNSLKYFRENANQYHVCGAGSLLGVKLKHTQGFPVGQVHFEQLYPLNFFEFLDALDQARLKNYLLELSADEEINEAIHQKCLEYLKYYLLVGGMPEAVDRYQKTQQFEMVRVVHRNILNSYDLDFIKHAPHHLVMKIRDCFHSITSQLGKENKKFIYSVIREGARARNYEEALEWLIEANLFYKVYHLSAPKVPLRAYEELQCFKAYFCDVGLLNTLADLPLKTLIHGNDLFQEFHGALTENFVAQTLWTEQHRLHYWTSDHRAEIDFILQLEDSIYPLEVKSGFSKHKKSLQVYMDKYNPPLSIRCSPMNLKRDGNLLNIPLYLLQNLNKVIALAK